MKKQKRILIIRPDRLGDVILSTPIPREIKKTYPDSFVAVFVREYTRAIFENNPHVDMILTDDFDEETRRSSFWNMVGVLRKLKFTDSLMLLPTERVNWMLFWAGIRNRIGVGHKLYQFLTFTRSVSRKKYIPLRSEADYCMDLARKIGVMTGNIATEIHFSDDEKIDLAKRKKQYRSKEEFLIGIHTTYGFSSPNVKPTIYRKVITELLTYSNIKVMNTDVEIPEEIKNIKGVIYHSGSLRDLFLNIASCDLFVSSSTGPAHVAGAVKTPTLTLFCPLPACSPTLWSPQGNEARYILPLADYCSNKCPGDPKKCFFEGEGGIDSQRILLSIFDYMREKGITPQKL